MEKEIALQMRGITKRFGPVLANNHVDLDVYRGEILAVLGENGCGKTTLMNMIAGIYYPDEGQILIDGREVVIRSPKDAFDYKIGMVHQHFKLVDLFTAAENIVLGMGEGERYNIREVNAQVEQITKRYGFSLDPTKKVYDLSVSEKQTVEIIKVLYRGADILILDEPTAVLTPQEITRLFNVLHKMREDGKSIIIITHKLNEVLEVSDRVAILRRGEHIATVDTENTTEAELTEMMVGKKISLNIDRSDPVNPTPKLEVTGLNLYNSEGIHVLKDITFTANSGEILGIAGIAGSGQKELLETIAGLQRTEKRRKRSHRLRRVSHAVEIARRTTSGSIVFMNPKKDQPVSLEHKTVKQVREMAAKGAFHDSNLNEVSFDGMSNRAVRKWVESGEALFSEDEALELLDKTPLEIRQIGVHMSFVPEDRLGMGLVGSMDLTDNMMLRSYRKGSFGFVNRKVPRAQAERIIKELEISTPGVSIPVRKLSGGNVQKVLVGREIAYSPKVLMAAYPVRGLDINSSYTIYRLLNQQKEKGVVVIYVGEDLDVLLELCDRILVMNSGAVTGIVDARTATKEEIGLMMTRTAERKEEEQI